MAADITLSSAVRNNLLSLQNTADLLGRTQERLATGLKVNSALDDPTAFFTASSLNARAGDLNRLLDSVGNALQTIVAADEGLSAITKLVETAQANVRQALQKPGPAGTSVAATETGNVDLRDDTAATSTSTLNTGSLAAGDDLAVLGFADGDSLTITGGGFTTVTIDFNNVGGAGALDLDGADNTGGNTDDETLGDLVTEINTQAGATIAAISGGDLVITGQNTTDAITFTGTNASTLLGLADASPTNAALAASSDTFTLTVGGGTPQNIDLTGVNSLSDLNGQLTGLTGVNASVDSGTGFLSITASNTTDSITFGGAGDTVLGLTDDGTFNPTAGTPTNNADRAALESEFNNLRTQLDELAADASFNGNNLLDGDNLTVIFNEEGTSTLSITGVTFDSAGLGINAAAADSFQSDTNLNTILGELETAIGSLRSQASTFGSNLSVVEIRQDFTKNLINTLETGAGNLTLADANEEGANTLALQTRQQLSSVALSLASQADQNVLRLF
ncbi:MAG: flagellar protein [Hyphomicrobiaceae bacterium]|nr:flagellar protein [Hyphomicrobiaceae bacterium]